jgi:hypothetical protein
MLVLEVEMLVLEIGNVGFKIGNVGFKNQKFWDGGRYFIKIIKNKKQSKNISINHFLNYILLHEAKSAP